MSLTRFLLIRHAESVWNAEERWQGQADPPLSERGRRQARRLAAELANEPIDCLLSSDLTRALQTAEIIGEPHRLTPEKDPRLRELDIGEWSGLRREEIERQSPLTLKRFSEGDPDARPQGGETRREIRLRARKALAEIGAERRGQRVAIVTHLGVIRALLPGTELENAGWCRVRADALATLDA